MSTVMQESRDASVTAGDSNAPAVNTVDLFDIAVCAETMDMAIERVHDAITHRRRLDIGVVNAAKIVNMHRDPELREAVTSSDVIYADGMAVVWASRFLGRPLPERVAGIDLMTRILEKGDDEQFRVFCLGATEEILGKTCAAFQRQYPGVTIAGSHHGYFDSKDEESIAREIGSSGADVLFVAITSPKKERFMARWADVINIPVVHGVGGSFDVVAGAVERAPESWQRLGLEWLYRVKQEPRRLWKRYFVTNILFLKMLLAQKIRELFGRR